MRVPGKTAFTALDSRRRKWPGPNIIDPSTVVAGEVPGTICGGNGTCTPDATTAWDIGLQALLDALTINGERHDLLIFFDNNQQGSTEPQNILVSGLVCVHGPNLADICYELVDQNGTNVTTTPTVPGNLADNVDPTLFQTTLGYGSALATNTNTATYPTGGPVLANGTFCVDNTSQQVVAANVQSSNDCPANSTFINNNLGSNLVEFIVGIPELNANMEQFLAMGYNRVSTELLFTNQNDGFEDVFLLAGPARPTNGAPEPGSLALLGAGLVGLWFRRRKQA